MRLCPAVACRRVLLVEDDKDLCQALLIHFKDQGYDTDICNNGTDGLFYALQNVYDLMILDRMLPELDGLTLLNTIRKRGIQTPVILATAMDSLDDKIHGLDEGADDYITKPFAPEELLARIRALTRRPRQLQAPGKLIWKDLAFDPQKLELSCGKNTLSLSKKEAGLMEYFLKNPEQCLKRAVLLSYVWGADTEVEEGNLDNYIYFLRRRLRTLKTKAKITTVHGVGYKLETEEET